MSIKSTTLIVALILAGGQLCAAFRVKNRVKREHQKKLDTTDNHTHAVSWPSSTNQQVMRDHCPKGTIYKGANKKCCKVDEGIGFCMGRAQSNSASIDTEISAIAAVNDFISRDPPIANLRVVQMSEKVEVKCTDDNGHVVTPQAPQTCHGFFNEWVDGDIGTFIHPGSANWGCTVTGTSCSEFCRLVKGVNDGGVQVATAMCQLAKRLGGNKKIRDFQGAVLKEGSFMFADIGSIVDDVSGVQIRELKSLIDCVVGKKDSCKANGVVE